MKVVQSKLKQCIEKGSMKTFEKLSSVLNTENDDNMQSSGIPEVVDNGAVRSEAFKGENKVPARKLRKQKYKFPKAKPTRTEDQEKATKPRPSYWCSF
mmetsp:Transcript_11833/g.27405  ORF Transcript_11833/g.27405 Transcript_11833/m.27405 type:complete len:98 (-) Transcript_11833:111-404(-)